ncbi:MAG: 4'-phosphopantetheinyl transferase superfamily protein [Alphaproteobacteria bacterium]|nr:4'-phosphopantetheinyl transferase superfamily protein [Alphaproteobacteria bacterium]
MSTEIVRDALHRMLPPGFVVDAAYPRIQNRWLYPDELAFIRGASARRQAEFGTARVHARLALGQLGARVGSLLPLPDRSPRWPAGVVGSISHTDDCCAVAVAPAGPIAGVGIDIEAAGPSLSAGIEEMICTHEERAWIARHQGHHGAGVLGRLIFCTKEALFKCQYNITRAFMDFREVELSIDLGRGMFAVADLRGGAMKWRMALRGLEGRFDIRAQFIVATAVLKKSFGEVV